MSDTLIAAIVSGVFALITATAVSYIGYLIAKLNKTVVEVKDVSVESKTAALEAKAAAQTASVTAADAALKIDGRFNDLVAGAKTLAFAEGRAEGVSVTEATAAEVQRAALQKATDHAQGLAEGRAEVRPPTSQGSV